MDGKRIQVSREEIGLVMSYATRPDRLTKDMIQKMVDGVTGPELLEIATRVGLPESTAIRLMDAHRPPRAADRSDRGMRDPRYRQALVGILVVMVVLNIAFASAAGLSGVGVVLLTGAGAGVAWIIYRVIGAISASSEARTNES